MDGGTCLYIVHTILVWLCWGYEMCPTQFTDDRQPDSTTNFDAVDTNTLGNVIIMHVNVVKPWYSGNYI